MTIDVGPERVGVWVEQGRSALETTRPIGADDSAARTRPVFLDAVSAEPRPLEVHEAWDGLVEREVGSVFDTPLWVLNYWRHRVGQRGGLTFLVGRSPAGEIVGLVPLVRHSHFGLAPVRRAVHATGEYPSDWLCLPGFEAGFATALCDELLGRRGARTQLLMSVVPETSAMLRAMVRECESRELPHQLRSARRIPFVDTRAAATAAVPLRGKYRRELRRRRRALEQSGPVTFETCTTLEPLEAAFEALVTVEGESWKGERGTSIGSRTATRRFWWEVAREAAERGCLRLDLLRSSGEVISGQLGLLWKRRYYCLKLGYDARMASFGPGALLTQHVIESCVAAPEIDVYDFAGTAQPYMWNWTEQFYETWTLTAGSRRRRR